MPAKSKKKEADALVAKIERLIITGNLVPRQRLIEADLSEMLNVSRYNIRDALKALESKGLVEIAPYRGAQVVDLNEKQVEDVHVIRVQMERLAAHLALQRIQPSDIANLKELEDHFEQSCAESDTENMIKYDMRFHDTIFELADNPILFQTIVELRNRLHATRYVSWASMRTLTTVVKEHRAIIAALEKQRKEDLDRLLEAHISHSKDSYVAQLNRHRAKMAEAL